VFCFVQFSKLHVVIQLAGGQAVLCNNNTVPSDAELISDTACIMWCDASQESNNLMCSWIQRIQKLLKRYYCRMIEFLSIYSMQDVYFLRVHKLKKCLS